MKVGIVTPVLHLNPRFEPPGWEETGSIDDVISVARAADRIGIDWLACSEHIAVPESASGIRGGRYWDPFTTLGAIASQTEKVSLLTHMVVLPYHHPLELVKRLGTLDLISHGRVVLGVGVGFSGAGVRSTGSSLRRTRGAIRRRDPGDQGVVGGEGSVL